MGTPWRSRGRILRLGAVLAVALGLVFVPGAGAVTVLSQDWESGLGSWTTGASGPGPNYWHVQTDPQTISVSPGITPDLVTLPDAGALPSAFDGNHAAWFGEAATGTYCGSDFATNGRNTLPGQAHDGCDSTQTPEGELISPTIDLTNSSTAILRFQSWFEIESVNSNTHDVLRVDYSIDDGATWVRGPAINPLTNPAGAPDQSYSDNGLGQGASWAPALVDISAAAGHAQVRLRFVFDAVDPLFNGFRGWLVDAIQLNTPFDAASATITSVDTCQGTANLGSLILHGSNFVQGSAVRVDGQPVATAVPSSNRAEIAAPAAGVHTLQVVSPGGLVSNSVSVTVGGCAGTGPGAGPGLGPGATPPGGSVPTVGTSPGGLITGLQVIPGSFRAAVSARSRAATTVRLTMRAAAAVSLAVFRLLPGRIGAHRACLAPTFARRRAPSCTRAVRQYSTMRLAAAPGVNLMRFTGRMGLLSLPPGSYVLVATPVGPGPAATPAGAPFRVTPASRHPGAAAPPVSLR